MTKYHITDNGNINKCNAKEGNCPYGNQENHFPTKELAFIELENRLKANKIKSTIQKLYENPYKETRELNDLLKEYKQSLSNKFEYSTIIELSYDNINEYKENKEKYINNIKYTLEYLFESSKDYNTTFEYVRKYYKNKYYKQILEYIKLLNETKDKSTYSKLEKRIISTLYEFPEIYEINNSEKTHKLALLLESKDINQFLKVINKEYKNNLRLLKSSKYKNIKPTVDNILNKSVLSKIDVYKQT